MNELSRLIESIEGWQFRNWNKVGLGPKYRKLCEEVGELGEAIINQDSGGILHEAGDVGVVLVGLLQEADVNIESALKVAHKKNMERKNGVH